MIFETNYWRLELERLARRLKRHMTQSRWLASSDASVEKSVMLGFYSIRKLLEAFQPPPNMNFNSKITTFLRNQNKLSSYPIQISWYFSKMVQENQIKFKKAPFGVDKMINEIIMKM